MDSSDDFESEEKQSVGTPVGVPANSGDEEEDVSVEVDEDCKNSNSYTIQHYMDLYFTLAPRLEYVDHEFMSKIDRMFVCCMRVEGLVYFTFFLTQPGDQIWLRSIPIPNV